MIRKNRERVFMGTPIFEIRTPTQHIRIFIDGVVKGVGEPYQVVNLAGPLLQHSYTSRSEGAPREKMEKYIEAIRPFQWRDSNAVPHQNLTNSEFRSGGSDWSRVKDLVIDSQANAAGVEK